MNQCVFHGCSGHVDFSIHARPVLHVNVCVAPSVSHVKNRTYAMCQPCRFVLCSRCASDIALFHVKSCMICLHWSNGTPMSVSGYVSSTTCRSVTDMKLFSVLDDGLQSSHQKPSQVIIHSNMLIIQV